MSKFVYTVNFNSKTRTLSLMDKFEERDETGKPIYNKLILGHVFSLIVHGIPYDISLMVERLPHQETFNSEGVTLTACKKELCGKTFEQDKEMPLIPKAICQVLEKGENRLSEPLLLKAQTTLDRTRSGGIHNNHYGVTTSYLIVGVSATKQSERRKSK